MKSLGLIILLLSSTVFAANPQIRICNSTGGLFHAMNVQQDEVGFCVYGSALMDSMSLLDVTSGFGTSQAIDAFLKSQVVSCEAVGAGSVKALDLEGKAFDLCAFRDGSYIGVETLRAGPEAASNSQLSHALQIRY